MDLPQHPMRTRPWRVFVFQALSQGSDADRHRNADRGGAFPLLFIWVNAILACCGDNGFVGPFPVC
jgi:hypothetical protein